jgi:hypothetical protein
MSAAKHNHCFYVYMRNAAAIGLLAGPCDTREQADDLVESTRTEAVKVDSWAHFYEFGTVSVLPLTDGPLPGGKLNTRLGLPTVADRPAANSYALHERVAC